MGTGPDIFLGPGDTGPAEQITLLDPKVPGALYPQPMNLQNGDLTFKTVVCQYQNRATSDPAVTRAVTILQTAPTVNRGMISIDWLATGGPVVPAGSSHDLRFVVTDNTGRQMTVPNSGALLLAVSPAFRGGTAVPGPATAWTWDTLDTVALLKALPTLSLTPGKTFYVVRESNKIARLDGNSGLPEDLNNGPFNTVDNVNLQWFYL